MLGKRTVIEGRSLETDSIMVPVAASEPVVGSSPVGIPMDVQCSEESGQVGVSRNQLLFYEVARAYLLYPAPSEHDVNFLSYLQAEIKKRTGECLETDVLEAFWNNIPDAEVDEIFARIDKDLERKKAVIGSYSIDEDYMDATDDHYIQQTAAKMPKHEAFVDISCKLKDKGMEIRPFDIFKYYLKNFRQPVPGAAVAYEGVKKAKKKSPLKEKGLHRIKVINKPKYVLQTKPSQFQIKSNVGYYVPNILPTQIFKSTTFFLFVSKQGWIVKTELVKLEYLIKVFGGKQVISDETLLEDTKKKVIGVVVGKNSAVAQNFCNETGMTLYWPSYIYKCIDGGKVLRRTGMTKKLFLAFEKKE